MNLSAVPSEVWESGEIIKLDLSRNSIQELPPELSSCVSLRVFFYLVTVFFPWYGLNTVSETAISVGLV